MIAQALRAEYEHCASQNETALMNAGVAATSFSGASFHESHGLLSSSSSTRRDGLETTDVLSSQLGGNGVALVAGNDIDLKAAQLHADGGIAARTAHWGIDATF